MTWFLLVVSLIWSVICWIEMYNSGNLFPFAAFITGAIFTEAIHAFCNGDFVIAMIDAIPTAVVLITYLVLKHNSATQTAK